jgi:hypothetical protein
VRAIGLFFILHCSLSLSRWLSFPYTHVDKFSIHPRCEFPFFSPLLSLLVPSVAQSMRVLFFLSLSSSPFSWQGLIQVAFVFFSSCLLFARPFFPPLSFFLRYYMHLVHVDRETRQGMNHRGRDLAAHSWKEKRKEGVGSDLLAECTTTIG